MNRNHLLCGVAAFALATTVQSMTEARAQAQQSSQRVALEEIVVTARKRQENLLDVPLSITAFTMRDIEKNGIDSVNDLANQVIGFSYKSGFGRLGSGNGGGSSNRPAIRGMSNILGDPNAAFFVDGVYVSGNPNSYQLDNLERIEVIRGPQSALFGRGTFAGAINFITRKPTNEVTGKAEVTYGQFDHFEANGYVSGPIVEDKLFYEVNARYYTFGGDYRNAVTGKRDIGDQKTTNGGIKLYATPSDNLTIEANYGYSHDQDLGFAEFFHGDTKNNCFLPRLGAPLFGIPRSATTSRGYFCGEIELPTTFYYFNDVLDAAGLWGSERFVVRSDLKIDYEINDWTVSLHGGYNHSEDNQLIDNFVDGVRGATNVSGGQSEVNDWSVEGRVLTPQQEKVRGLAGVYMYRQKNGSGFTRTLSSLTADNARETISGIYSDDDSGVRNWAVFGMVEAEFAENFTGSFEARYQEDKLRQDNDRNGISEYNAKYTAFLPRGTLRYAIDDDSNVYATVAKGNKPGGFNALPLTGANPIVPEDLAAALAAGVDRYDEESLWTYEIGYKGSFADNQVTFTGALFWNDWTNQALTNGFPYRRVNSTPTTIARLVNIGKSRIRGIELDTTLRPTDWFDLRLAYSYNEAEIRDYVDENEQALRDTDGILGNEATQGDPTGQVAGNQIPQTPAHNLIVSPQFRYDLGNDTEVFLRGDLTYESNRWAQTHNLAGTGDSYLLNLRSGIEKDNWTLTFFVNNALQDKTPTVITRLFNFNKPLLVPDPITRFAGQPLRFTFFRDFRVGAPRKREFGATAVFRF